MYNLGHFESQFSSFILAMYDLDGNHTFLETFEHNIRKYLQNFPWHILCGLWYVLFMIMMGKYKTW